MTALMLPTSDVLPGYAHEMCPVGLATFAKFPVVPGVRFRLTLDDIQSTGCNRNDALNARRHMLEAGHLVKVDRCEYRWATWELSSRVTLSMAHDVLRKLGRNALSVLACILSGKTRGPWVRHTQRTAAADHQWSESTFFRYRRKLIAAGFLQLKRNGERATRDRKATPSLLRATSAGLRRLAKSRRQDRTFPFRRRRSQNQKSTGLTSPSLLHREEDATARLEAERIAHAAWCEAYYATMSPEDAAFFRQCDAEKAERMARGEHFAGN